MELNADCSSSNGFSRINQFALVSYIPDPLASFLDDLRLHLVPDCRPHAHVTILPPRPLCGNGFTNPEQAARELRQVARHFKPFVVRLGKVAKFPLTDVIHLELETGKAEIEAMYHAMNSGSSSFCEPFPFHPHITLGQNLPKEHVASIFEAAEAAWKACPYDRSFEVRQLAFVQNTTICKWIDLEDIVLTGRSPVARAPRRIKSPAPQLAGPKLTRTNPAEPLRRS